MVCKGEIQRVERNEWTDKATGEKRVSVRILVMDKTKAFRCTSPFQFSMSVDKWKQKFGTKRYIEYTDEPVTFTITDLKAENGFLRVTGEIVLGHHTAEALFDMFDPEAPAATPAPAKAPAVMPKAA